MRGRRNPRLTMLAFIAPEERVRVEGRAEVLEVGALGDERGDPALQALADVAGVGRVGAAGDEDVADAAPGLEALVDQLAEDPAVAGVAGGVAGCQPDGAVVALVQRRRARPARSAA